VVLCHLDGERVYWVSLDLRGILKFRRCEGRNHRAPTSEMLHAASWDQPIAGGGMAQIAIGRPRTPAKPKRRKPRPQELLAQYERVQAKDLLKGDLIEPNEISGSLRVIGPSRINGREVILTKTDDTLAREFFLPSTAMVRLLDSRLSGKR
jgi:hypothetical protein